MPTQTQPLPPSRENSRSLEAQTPPDDPRAPETVSVPPLVPAVVPPAKPSPPVPPRRGKRPWIWGLGLVVALIAGGALYFQPWASNTVGVAFETVAEAPATRLLAVNGRIAATHSVDLRPQVSGTLDQITVAEGDTVSRGDVLARIDPSAQQAAARQAVAALDAALVAQDQAQSTYARSRELGGNVALATLENAERAVRSAAQEVARVTALVDAAQIRLDDYTIRAPIAGTVLVLDVDLGQSVDTSTVLMTIADLSLLEVKTDVDEAYATQIAPGQRAVLQLAGETALREGRVSAVSQRVDAATGGLAVTLLFDAPVTAPVALTVTANIIVESLEAAITLPRAAVRTGAQGDTVFVVTDGIAQPRPVQVTDWPAARLVVTEGLSPGEVVIADATGITAGQAVAEVRP